MSTTRFEIPTGQFGTIYADPPWPYDEKQNARRRLHYDRMTLEEICAIPVADVCHPDAHLWLWATTTHLELAFQVIHAWGFEYKTTCVWRKNRLGLGWWVRNRHEFLLRAVRSNNYRPNPGKWSSEITGSAGKHSEKPDSAYDMIEALSPGPRLELFSRDLSPRGGWTTLGSDKAPTEAYGNDTALRGRAPDPGDGIVRGVGGLEIEIGREYHYLEKTVTRTLAKAVRQNGRRVSIEIKGKKKSVSIDRLREVE